ncbi:MAG TPA: NADH-quinone oxidoreductase subunit N [Candidatus Limnocylindrales bacterium]|nr:NADH-quinone oxidoreductase subunit N [Candidatus Limnocylindrales bacterium]
MELSNFQSLSFFYPELILSGFIVLLFLVDLIFLQLRSSNLNFRFFQKEDLLAGLTLMGLGLALISVILMFPALRTPLEGYWLFHRMIAVDNFALFFKILVILATILIVLISVRSKEVSLVEKAEYYTLLLAITLAMMLFASATNLLMVYMALEMVSVISYVLSGYLKTQRKSSEAALKYCIYGGVASGVMVYGISFVYGLTGSLNFSKVHEALDLLAEQKQLPSFTLLVASILMLAGFGYKIASVPFHMWVPDVYEGAPTPITAFFSIGPKAAGFAALIRFFYEVLSVPSSSQPGTWIALGNLEWPMLMAIVSAVTMTLGNLVAIVQNNLKRLLAYSSIAHVGYILMGFSVLTDQGIRAMIFYLMIYLIMNLGAFLVVIYVSDRLGSEEISGYTGLAWRMPYIACAMGVFLFSLTGIPPLAGFIGKFFLFAAVIEKKLYWLALIGLLNSVISLYYYARIIKAMFLDQAVEQSPQDAYTSHPLYEGLLGALMILTVLFGVYWSPLVRLADHSLKFLR